METSVAVVLLALCCGTCLAQNGNGSSSTEGATPAPIECNATYTIMEGDTFNSIAASLGVTVAALQEANPDVENINNIFAGDDLQVPCDAVVATEEAPDPSNCRTTHVVGEGNTTSMIAQCYGVTIQQIRDVNPSLVDINNLFVGQEMIIPPCDGSSNGTLDVDCGTTKDPNENDG